ncbi:MAG: hypothetical protein WCJ70_01800 [bacterium]
MKLMSSIRTIFARSVRPSEQLIRIALWLLIIYLSYLLTGWYVTRDDTYLQLPDVTSPIARLFPTATPTSTPTMTPYPTYPPPTPTPTPSLINPTVLHDDLYLSYIHHDHTAKTSTFTEIDFLTNTKVDHELPYLNSNSSVDGLRYLISPDHTRLLRVSSKSIEIADISHIPWSSASFKAVFGPSDLLWSFTARFDSAGNVFFLEGFPSIEGRVCPEKPKYCYMNIHMVNLEGKDIILNDHTNQNQRFQNAQEIVAIDESRREIYLDNGGFTAEAGFIPLSRARIDSPDEEELGYIYGDGWGADHVYDQTHEHMYITSDLTDAMKLLIPRGTKIFEYSFRSKVRHPIFSLDTPLLADANHYYEWPKKSISLLPINFKNKYNGKNIYFSVFEDVSNDSVSNTIYELDTVTKKAKPIPIDCLGTTVTTNGYTLCEDNTIENIHTGAKIQLSESPLDIVAFESGRRLTGGKDMYGLEPINPASTASDPRVAFDIPKVMAQVDDSEVKSVKRVTCDKDLSYFDPTQKELVYRSSARSPVPPTPTPLVRSRLGEEFISRRAYPQIYDVVQKLSQKEKLGTDSFFRFCKIEGGVDFVLFGNNDSLGNTWKRVDLPLTDPYTAKETSIKLNQVFESSTIVYSDSDRYILYSQGGDVSLFRRLELIDPQTRSQRRFFSCEHYKQDDSEFMCDYSRTPCKDIYKGSAENINDVAFHTDCTVYRTVPWIEVRESLK